MFKRLILLTFSLIILNFYTPKVVANECEGSPWSETILDKHNKHTQAEFPFLEERNDPGIFLDFKWDEDLQKIIIKRDKDNYPIVKFSLFNKEEIKQGSVIKSYATVDLSKANDAQLNATFDYESESNYVVIIELKNGKKIEIESKPYKLNDFKLVNFQLDSIQNIDSKKGIIEISFRSFFENNRPDLLDTLIKNDFDYDENNEEPICETVLDQIILPIKALEYNEFKYDEDVRKGLKNKTKLKDSIINFAYDKGNFRSVRSESGVGFFRQEFDFRKFPFDKQKLIINITSGIRSSSDKNLIKFADTAAVTFITPENGAFSGLNNFKEKNYLKEWKVLSVDIKSKEIIDENYYDKDLKKNITHNENAINLEINIEREYKHYIYKIIIPVFLILCVAWFVLWIPTKHFETRLTTSMVALLSLIAYNFVFADDIPKLQYLTSLDKYILLSYVFCCIPTFMSIWCSRFIKISQAKVTKVNRKIRIFGGLIYLVSTMQIFYS
jgi:hypothetical protein